MALEKDIEGIRLALEELVKIFKNPPQPPPNGGGGGSSGSSGGGSSGGGSSGGGSSGGGSSGGCPNCGHGGDSGGNSGGGSSGATPNTGTDTSSSGRTPNTGGGLPALPEPVTDKPEIPPVLPDEEEDVTLADLRSLGRQLQREGKRAQIKKILSRYDAIGMTTLEEQYYDEVYKEIKKL